MSKNTRHYSDLIKALNVESQDWSHTETFPVRLETKVKAGEHFSPADRGVVTGDGKFPMQWIREQGPAIGGITLAAGYMYYEPCVMDFTFEGEETIYVVKGSADVVDGDGQLIQLREGDMAYFGAGAVTTWTIPEPSIHFFTILD